MTLPRVVITGMGPVSAIGVGCAAFAESLQTGTSGISAATLFETDPDGPQLAAEVTHFNVEDLLDSRKGYLDRSSAFALGSIALARDDAGLKNSDLSEAGLALGSAFGSLDTAALFFDGYMEKGPRLVKPFLFPHTYPNTAISLAAIEFEIKGPHINFSGGTTSSAQAIAAAFDWIRQGKANVVFAGGYEALSELLYSGSDEQGLLSLASEPADWAGPLDAESDGTVLGEGAGVLVLESYEHAVARGARVQAELVEIALSGGREGSIADSMRAVRNVGPAGTTGTVFVSANGCLESDQREMDALNSVFTDAAPAVTALKHLTGETLGAACGLQLIAAILSARARHPQTNSNQDLNSNPNQAIEEGHVFAFINAIDPGVAVATLGIQVPLGEK